MDDASSRAPVPTPPRPPGIHPGSPVFLQQATGLWGQRGTGISKHECADTGEVFGLFKEARGRGCPGSRGCRDSGWSLAGCHPSSATTGPGESKLLPRHLHSLALKCPGFRDNGCQDSGRKEANDSLWDLLWESGDPGVCGELVQARM